MTHSLLDTRVERGHYRMCRHYSHGVASLRKSQNIYSKLPCMPDHKIRNNRLTRFTAPTWDGWDSMDSHLSRSHHSITSYYLRTWFYTYCSRQMYENGSTCQDWYQLDSWRFCTAASRPCHQQTWVASWYHSWQGPQIYRTFFLRSMQSIRNSPECYICMASTVWWTDWAHEQDNWTSPQSTCSWA